MKIVSSIEDQIGGFIDDEKKKIAESLSRRDVVEITKALIDVIRNSINRNIQYIISKDLS
jgi:L-rhamnose isomerase